jgi:hypothetical protein
MCRQLLLSLSLHTTKSVQEKEAAVWSRILLKALTDGSFPSQHQAASRWIGVQNRSPYVPALDKSNKMTHKGSKATKLVMM